MTSLSTATDVSGVMALPSAPRPHGNNAGSSASKQIFCPVRGQTSAQLQSRLAKLTVVPLSNDPLPWTHSDSKNPRATSLSGWQLRFINITFDELPVAGGWSLCCEENPASAGKS